MQRTHVSSSNLSSVGYDSVSQTLEIEFLSGGVYQYLNVLASTYHGLMSAASKGSYFATWIKDRFSYRRIR